VALLKNIRVGWKNLSGTNTLAYWAYLYDMKKESVVNSAQVSIKFKRNLFHKNLKDESIYIKNHLIFLTAFHEKDLLLCHP
jgi:hypothetical protein